MKFDKKNKTKNVRYINCNLGALLLKKAKASKPYPARLKVEYEGDW